MNIDNHLKEFSYKWEHRNWAVAGGCGIKGTFAF